MPELLTRNERRMWLAVYIGAKVLLTCNLLFVAYVVVATVWKHLAE